jgi:hypothetical protein
MMFNDCVGRKEEEFEDEPHDRNDQTNKFNSEIMIIHPHDHAED